MVRYRSIFYMVGFMLCIVGIAMLTALPFSWYFNSGDGLCILNSSLITIGVGASLLGLTYKSREPIHKREGYLIVVLGWVAMSAFACLPYLLSGTMDSFTDAIFESISGLSTTGASVMTDIESTSEGILFWRSLTQWIGGLGIIVLTVAIAPLLGVGGVELFVAEAPGPTADKIHPRISETAKRLWLIYVGLTVALCIILWIEGMTFYDAINHALTTMATGGFSTKNSSIAFFNSPLIEYTLIVFMLFAGTNFTILYFVLKRKFKFVWGSDEFKAYLSMVGFFILLVTGLLYLRTDAGLEQTFREAAFQVVSVITTTGFASADYTTWGAGLTMIFLLLLFTGASAGSTSGGIKVIRHLVFIKNSIYEFKRLLHPRAIIRLKIDKKIVAPRILTHILVFLLIYLFIFVVGTVLMVFILEGTAHPLLTAIGSVATSLGNVGPGIGEVGPSNNFSQIPDSGLWVLSVLMLLGRLELFTVLILVTKYFWKAN